MYRFVLWGYGKRGRRFMEVCPNKHIIAIIDADAKVREMKCSIPIISYEEYKEKYIAYDIVIAVDDNAEIRQKLEDDKIFTYHLLEDCPPEIVGYGGGRWINELPLEIKEETSYLIYGLSLYTILLREYILSNYNIKDLSIIPETRTIRDQEFCKKYSYITFKKIRKEPVLIGISPKFNDTIDENWEDVFDFSEKIAEYRNPKLCRFKNKYKGEKCFIVATGPSLTMQDLDLLKKSNTICFGVNRIYLSFNQTNWRPDYLVVVDDKILKTYWEEIVSCDVKIKFIDDQVKKEIKDSSNIYRIHSYIREYFPGIPDFSTDIEKKVCSGRTVVYSCIQIACYMGFNEIYLLGTDHNYSSNQSDISNHFHKDYYQGGIRPDNYFKEKAELSYQAAKKYAEEHGIKIYNATRGGKLEVFERVDFDSLFK